MAQLRDAQTSELLAEGTPEDVAIAALDFAPGSIIFDDVGPSFDPAAVLANRDERVAGLEAAIQAGPPEGIEVPGYQSRLEAALEYALEVRVNSPAAMRKQELAQARCEDEPAPTEPPPIQVYDEPSPADVDPSFPVDEEGAPQPL